MSMKEKEKARKKVVLVVFAPKKLKLLYSIYNIKSENYYYYCVCNVYCMSILSSQKEEEKEKKHGVELLAPIVSIINLSHCLWSNP